MHVLESGVQVTRSLPRPTGQQNRSTRATEQRASEIRTGTGTDAAGPAIIGSMAWHTVVQQLREQAVQETDRALADASDHLKTLLVDKVNKLADLCGFVAHISSCDSGVHCTHIGNSCMYLT